MRVLPDIIPNLLARHQKPALLRHKQGGRYRDISTEEFVARVRCAVLGLHDAGIERGDRVVLLSENRPEWTISDLALQCLGAVNVPIYPTLLAEQIRFILADCGAKAILCSTPDQVDKVEGVRGGLSDLQTVIAFDPPQAGNCRAWSDVSGTGERRDASRPGRFDQFRAAVQPEDLASIIYTSGTTGVPKGVMLTHRNFVSNVAATLEVMPISEEDVALSFLPLSHVLERMVGYVYLATGATIGYAESFETIPQNLVEIRPTVVTAVPRVFEKFHARVMETVRSGSFLRRGLAGWALKVARRRAPFLVEGKPLPGRLDLAGSVADRLVLAKIRSRVGGRLRYFISGGAALNSRLAQFFWGVGLPVFEGYGLTETSPVIAVNRPGRTRLGSVGPPLPGVEVRIDEDGEILVRGDNVMQGYYRNEEANRQAFRDGWFCTGDVGHLDEQGFLWITDRKKDLLSTSGGKLVAPQPMENALKTSRYIANAVIVGEGRKFISALLVPDLDNLRRYCREQGLPEMPAEDLIREPRVLELYRGEVERKMEGRARYERVKEFRLLAQDFTLEANEITPKMSVKRNVVEKKHRDLINSMYPDAPDGEG